MSKNKQTNKQRLTIGLPAAVYIMNVNSGCLKPKYTDKNMRQPISSNLWLESLFTHFHTAQNCYTRMDGLDSELCFWRFSLIEKTTKEKNIRELPPNLCAAASLFSLVGEFGNSSSVVLTYFSLYFSDYLRTVENTFVFKLFYILHGDTWVIINKFLISLLVINIVGYLWVDEKCFDAIAF